MYLDFAPALAGCTLCSQIVSRDKILLWPARRAHLLLFPCHLCFCAADRAERQGDRWPGVICAQCQSRSFYLPKSPAVLRIKTKIVSLSYKDPASCLQSHRILLSLLTPEIRPAFSSGTIFCAAASLRAFAGSPSAVLSLLLFFPV